MSPWNITTRTVTQQVKPGSHFQRHTPPMPLFCVPHVVCLQVYSKVWLKRFDELWTFNDHAAGASHAHVVLHHYLSDAQMAAIRDCGVPLLCQVHCTPWCVWARSVKGCVCMHEGCKEIQLGHAVMQHLWQGPSNGLLHVLSTQGSRTSCNWLA